MAAIIEALRQLFGTVGGAVPFDVLRFEAKVRTLYDLFNLILNK